MNKSESNDAWRGVSSSRLSLSDLGDDARARDWTLAGCRAPLVSQMSEFWKGRIMKNLKRELKKKRCIGWRKWKVTGLWASTFLSYTGIEIIRITGLTYCWALACSDREWPLVVPLTWENPVLQLCSTARTVFCFLQLIEKNWLFKQLRPLEKIWLSR